MVVEGLNISELRLITGPAGADGADVVLAGTVGADSGAGATAGQTACSDEQGSSAKNDPVTCGLIFCDIHACYSS